MILLFDILVFEDILSNNIPYFKYIDELLTAIIALIAIRIVIKKKRIEVSGSLIKAAVFFILFLIVGLCSSLFNGLSIEITVIIKDILAISKFIICYIGSCIIFRNLDKDYILERIQKRSKIYIMIFLAFAMVNLILDIGMGFGIRYGFRSFRFLFSHPTYLVASCVILVSVLCAKNEKENRKYINFGLIVLLLSFRTKAFMFIIIYLIFKYFNQYVKDLKIKHIAIIAILGAFIFKDKILDYAQYGLTAARPALYIVGVKLLFNYFPFGSGFGTFASSLSGRYYSPLYKKYGISTVLGLRPERYNYMADTFWPYIYGQFGVIGLILFVLVLVNLFIDIKGKYEYSEEKSKASLLIFLYILTATTSESIFTGAQIILPFITLATFLGNNKDKDLKVINIDANFFREIRTILFRKR